MPAKNADALSLSSTISSGLRPILRPCKDDIEKLTRMHSLKGGLGTPQEKAAETRSLLLDHGALVDCYPCWHPIRRFLARLENKPALSFDPCPPNAQFDHFKRFQWAIIGWPYGRLEDMHEFERTHRAELARYGLQMEVQSSTLYNDGAAHAVVLSVKPLLVRWYRGLNQEGWLAVLQGSFTAESIEYAQVNKFDRMEPYEAMKADYYGASEGHPGLHGFANEAFDAELVRRMEPWHYAFQYRLVEAKHGSVEDAAYEKLIAAIGPAAPELVRDALLAARSV